MTNEIILQPDFDSLFILITNKCNIECKHCYVSSSPNGSYGLSFPKIQETIIHTRKLFPKIRVVISGGEPFTRKSEIFKLLDEFNNSTPFLILSNGMLITESTANRLSTYNNLKLRLSLDGANAEKHDFLRGSGSFEKLLEGIKKLKKSGFNFDNLQFSSTISVGNEASVEEIISLAKKLGISKVKFEPIAKTGNALDHWDDYHKNETDKDSENYKNLIKKITSERHQEFTTYSINDAGFKDLTIYSNGDVYPFTYLNEIDKEYGLVGNINIERIDYLIKNPKMSNSILNKFLHYSMGPHRSLGATMFNI
ncbi:radical SAM/SPASM domain-containing protein [Flavobacterium sp. WC2429]|jgi:MoaA/NifB/PqqE/SkfB family radical SAM enzyme|uniref:Radical SAM/SPASM domain-containing protein n=1 Tax=Flavobacterium sp. WC2429 TaxID=3234140 RepID=A0AB39WJ43_9FLAO